MVHTQFIAQRIKDAVVDQLREKHGRRPSVDRDDPDLRIHAHVYRDRDDAVPSTPRGRPCTSGDGAATKASHRWRKPWRPASSCTPGGTGGRRSSIRSAAPAPCWSRPRCWPPTSRRGCGGASGSSAGRSRRHGWRRMCDQASAQLRAAESPPASGQRLEFGFRVEQARDNAAAADVGDVEVEVADARSFAPRRGWNAWVVANCRSGERVGEVEDLRDLLAAFGETLRAHCAGYRCGLLSGDKELSDALGLDERKRVAIPARRHRDRAVVRGNLIDPTRGDHHSAAIFSTSRHTRRVFPDQIRAICSRCSRGAHLQGDVEGLAGVVPADRSRHRRRSPSEIADVLDSDQLLLRGRCGRRSRETLALRVLRRRSPRRSRLRYTAILASSSGSASRWPPPASPSAAAVGHRAPAARASSRSAAIGGAAPGVRLHEVRAERRRIWMTPPFFLSASSCSSSRFRDTSQTARQPECEAMTGAFDWLRGSASSWSSPSGRCRP